MVIHVFQENTKRVWVGKNQGRSYIIIVYRVRQLANNDNSIITYNAAHQQIIALVRSNGIEFN